MGYCQLVGCTKSFVQQGQVLVKFIFDYKFPGETKIVFFQTMLATFYCFHSENIFLQNLTDFEQFCYLMKSLILRREHENKWCKLLNPWPITVFVDNTLNKLS